MVRGQKRNVSPRQMFGGCLADPNMNLARSDVRWWWSASGTEKDEVL
jgi:hypothetical protein